MSRRWLLSATAVRPGQQLGQSSLWSGGEVTSLFDLQWMEKPETGALIVPTAELPQGGRAAEKTNAEPTWGAP